MTFPPISYVPFFFKIDDIEKAITNIGHPPAAKEKEHDDVKKFLKKVMQYLLGTYINKMRHTECEGCVRSFLSQRDHSCLMEETEYHIDKHFDSALSSVSQDFVAGVFAVREDPPPIGHIQILKSLSGFFRLLRTKTNIL